MTVVPISKHAAPEVVTEDSAALEFVGRYDDMLRFDHSEGAWFRFDGATWRRDGTGAAHDWARELVRKMAEAERNDATRAKLGRASFARGVEAFARNDQRIAVESNATLPYTVILPPVWP